jgi:hypothetical protein
LLAVVDKTIDEVTVGSVAALEEQRRSRACYEDL